MMHKNLSALCLAACLVTPLVAPAVAHADGRRMRTIPSADKGAPMASWTPAQQWWNGGKNAFGYYWKPGVVALADELGDHLAETGRASLISRCFAYAKPDATAAIAWGVCGADVAALDLQKLDAQLAADHVADDDRHKIVQDAREIVEHARKIGDAVEAAAKDDPGVAAVIAAGKAARTEWAAYLAGHQAQYDRFLALQDGIRSGKTTHPSFAGCWDATYPAFAKLVKATKLPLDLDDSPLPGYLRYLVTSPEGFVTTASYAACAWSIDRSGEALFAATMDQPSGVLRVGPRSLALAKVLDPSFKPKFADRTINFRMMRDVWLRERIEVDGINKVTAIATPAQATVATAKRAGDAVQLKFRSDTVDVCLQWRDTKRVKSIGPSGDVHYDKTCVRRGRVANQENETEIAARFAGGIKPGVNVVLVYKFPAVVRKGRKLVAVLGVPLK